MLRAVHAYFEYREKPRVKRSQCLEASTLLAATGPNLRIIQEIVVVIGSRRVP